MAARYTVAHTRGTSRWVCMAVCNTAPSSSRPGQCRTPAARFRRAACAVCRGPTHRPQGHRAAQGGTMCTICNPSPGLGDPLREPFSLDSASACCISPLTARLHDTPITFFVSSPSCKAWRVRRKRTCTCTPNRASLPPCWLPNRLPHPSCLPVCLRTSAKLGSLIVCGRRAAQYGADRVSCRRPLPDLVSCSLRASAQSRGVV